MQSLIKKCVFGVSKILTQISRNFWLLACIFMDQLNKVSNFGVIEVNNLCLKLLKKYSFALIFSLHKSKISWFIVIKFCRKYFDKLICMLRMSSGLRFRDASFFTASATASGVESQIIELYELYQISLPPCERVLTTGMPQSRYFSAMGRLTSINWPPLRSWSTCVLLRTFCYHF